MDPSFLVLVCFAHVPPPKTKTNRPENTAVQAATGTPTISFSSMSSKTVFSPLDLNQIEPKTNVFFRHVSLM